jgi:tetratricopeptide (TPR) repeat protein
MALVFHSVAEPTRYRSSLSLHLSQGEYEQGVQDCDSALALCKDSCRALYRKALCLRELGRFREAYNCSTGCLLATPNVSNIMNYPFTSEAVFLD